jgi:hypothetical protein
MVWAQLGIGGGELRCGVLHQGRAPFYRAEARRGEGPGCLQWHHLMREMKEGDAVTFFLFSGGGRRQPWPWLPAQFKKEERVTGYCWAQMPSGPAGPLGRLGRKP